MQYPPPNPIDPWANVVQPGTKRASPSLFLAGQNIFYSNLHIEAQNSSVMWSDIRPSFLLLKGRNTNAATNMVEVGAALLYPEELKAHSHVLQLLRGACGWCPQLPPPRELLASPK